MSKDEKDRRIKHSIDIKKLIKANFYKHNNEYICPITRKYFNKHTKIILNRKTGNVYSSEIYKLFHNKNEMFDPITHDKISKEDFIVLQDPLNNKTSYVASHLNDRDQEDNEKKKKNIFAPSIQDNGAIMSILKEMEEAKKEKRKKEQEEEEEKKKKVYGILQDYNSDSNESEHSNEKKKMLKNKKDEYNKNIHSTNYDSDSSENEIKIKCTNYSDNKLAQSVTSTISNVT
ncbi:cyclophilin [Plasmodium falciparum IGH-CR14]|nr:cyclophilin [Plasmodium falciparum IGH-CR14]